MKATFSTIIFLIFILTVQAQTVYTRSDTIAITEDSITLNTEQFRGEIQWQHSNFGDVWQNLENKTDSTLKISSSKQGYYRAQITDGTCALTYSDTVVITGENFTTPPIVSVNSIKNLSFIDRDNDTFTFEGYGDDLSINTVLVDNENKSDIRIVTNVHKNGNTVIVQTDPGNMENLFANTSFKISTEPIVNNPKPVQQQSNLKKATKNIDTDGFIHPVEVNDNLKPKLKSTSILNDDKPLVYFEKDFSGTKLYNKNGVELTITDGYYNLGAEIKCEFEFDQEEFHWDKIPTGKLTGFRFYTDPEKTGAEAKFILMARASGKIEIGESFELYDTPVFNRSFKYMIGGVPVWMDVKMNLMASYNATFSAEASISGGASASSSVKLGLDYRNGKWTPIKDHTNEFQLHGPDIVGKAGYEIILEVYPHVEIVFYNLIGPYFDISPYLAEKSHYSITNNSDFELYSGLKARIGCTGAFASEFLSDFGLSEWSLSSNLLYKAPNNLEIISGNNQKGVIGEILDETIVLKVTDSDGAPVSGCPVHLKPQQGTVNETSPQTDGDGKVEIEWTMPEEVRDECALEGWLENGKDKKNSNTLININAGPVEEFKTVKIGSQIWMAENLDIYVPTIDYNYNNLADSLYDVFCWDNAPYGKLYTWNAAKKACPAGWHLPNNQEWQELINYLGGYLIAGGKMKSVEGWNMPNIGATNSSGFNALPAGLNYDGSFKGAVCNFWSSNLLDDDSTYDYYMAYVISLQTETARVVLPPLPRETGASVRCVKD